jgi:serine/alanine adding enzyme
MEHAIGDRKTREGRGMRIVQQLSKQPWRDFVDSNPMGNIFHTPEMFRVLTQAKRHKPSLWAVVGGNYRPLALMLPVQVTLMGGLLHQFTTRAIAYGSVLCASGPDGDQALEMLLQAYKKNTKNIVLFTELRNLSDLNHLQPVLNGQGFIYEDHLNYLIDLHRSPEAIMQSIGSRTRKNLRRALRRGEVVIEEVNQREQVALCYELLRRTYAAAQVPLADQSLFEAAFDVLHPRGMVKFLLARIGDSYVAGSVELVYKDTIYGWYGGMDRAYSGSMPNELLLWHIFRWGAENGYKVYDFGGAGRPDEKYGVRDFKAKFGGELVCFGRNTYIPWPWLHRLGTWGYALYRRLI